MSAVADDSATSGQEVDIADILGADELVLLGEATAYAAMIEAVAAGIHGALTRAPGAADLAFATTAGKRIGWLLTELVQSPDLDVAAWADQARSAIDRRHELVHTAWLFRIASQEGELVFGLRSHAVQFATVLQATDFNDVRDACKEVYNAGRRLSRFLHGL